MKIVTAKSKTKRPAAGGTAKAKPPATRAASSRAQRPASAGTRRKAADTRTPPTARKPAARPVPAAAAPKAPKATEAAKKPAVKPAAPKAAPAAPKTAAKPAAPAPVAKKPVAPPEPVAAAKKPAAAPVAKAPEPPKPVKKVKEEPSEFGPKDYIVYPTHGVGYIQQVERQEIAGITVELFVITFEKDKMTLRVPVSKAKHVGMRKLSTPKIMDSALATLKGRARVKRTMWSRRAQEYEAKINSGDPVAIAEVIRDLHRSANQPDQSYSERQIYEAALERLARELAAVEKIDEAAATERLEKVLRAA
jgi:CarD family transcriptional regulator